jgi:hypothetical protein
MEPTPHNRHRRPPLTGKQRMVRAVLVGLIAFAVCCGYSWWLVYRADVAAQRLKDQYVLLSYRPDAIDACVARVLPARWMLKWHQFRTRSVQFQSDREAPAAAFAELRHLPFIEKVYLSRVKFNPHDLVHLGTARQLQELDLRSQGRRISDDTLEPILELRGLRVLRLSQTCLSDEGVARLAALRQLRELDLRYCQCVSRQAVDLLAARLPGCRIDYESAPPIHRFTCPDCGYAVNRGEWLGDESFCPKCHGPGPLLVQRNFDICHPVIEHQVPVRKAVRDR